MNININDAEDFSCEECENYYFAPVFAIKRISPLISPTGQEVMVPIQLFECSACGHVNKSFIDNSVKKAEGLDEG
jgi:hypothetical protein